MAVTINVATSSGLDLRWATLYNLFANASVQDGGTSAQFTAIVTGQFDGNDADVRFIVDGIGFTYSGTTPDISLAGGTINTITMQTEAGVTLATFTGFSIDGVTFAAALDTYAAGGPGNTDPSALDAIFEALQYNATGGGGNDIFEGGNLDDPVVGGAGNDIAIGGAGADSFDGGTGTLDLASYITSTSGLTVDLLTPANNTGDAVGDTYTNVEGLEGSNHNDDLRGDNTNNFLIGGAGADTLDGRGGFDFASYVTATLGVTASLANPGANTGDAAGDIYANIEHLSGSNRVDTLIGDAANNFLMGRGGADSLQGGNGSDTADYFLSTIGLTVDLGNIGNNTGEAIGDSYTSIENLRGSAFADTLRGNSGNNLLDGQAGADMLDGGAGFDFAWYNTNSTGTGVTASLANSAVNTGDAAGDTYISIEGLVGSSDADTLIGDAANNLLRGQFGADALDGSGGFDFADYVSATSAVTVDLSNPLNNAGDAAGDTFTSLEGIRGSAFNDTLRGDDAFNGGAAVNELRGGLGADVLDGGGGFDYADYRDSNIGLTVNLGSPASNNGEATGDAFISIEGIIGTNFIDVLTGNANSDNWLLGGLDADIINGGGVGGGGPTGVDYAAYWNAGAAVTASLANPASNTDDAAGDIYFSIAGLVGSSFADTLTGDGAGNFLIGAAGADVLDGGAGNDTARYTIWTQQVGLVANLANSAANTGDAIGDNYISIENLWGTPFGDTLIGDGNVNILTGDAGNDTLDGNGGADTLVGGIGNDTYVVDTATDVIIEGAGFGNDVVRTTVSYTLAAGVSAELLATTSNAGTGNINLTGNEFGQTINGNAGSNIINGGAGADTMTGFGGNDTYFVDSATDVIIEGAGLGNDVVRTTVSYALAAGVSAELLATTSNAGTGNINLTGNEFGQTINGNAGSNIINGGAGADTMTGFGGNDTYFVDSATDVIIEVAGGGNDTVRTTISYTLAAGVSAEMLATTSNAGTGNINLTGNEFGQTINGNAGNNVINGGAGADTMTGFGGNDTYFVDSATDVIIEVAGGGNDTVRTTVSYTLAAGVSAELLATTSNAGTGNINLTGNEFAQTINGNAGNNVINGGGGSDTITTFGGADSIVFSNALGPSNVDMITDFNPTSDTIHLENAIFTALTSLGTLDASAFEIGSGATSAQDRIIYNNATGALIYDADGLGGVAAMQFATLASGLAGSLTNNDFLII